MTFLNQYFAYIWLIINCIFHMVFVGLPCYVIVLCLIPFMSEENIHKFISYLGTMYFKICIWASGVKIHIYGIENIDKGHHYIYMSNHTSNFDVPIYYATVLPYNVISVYKHALIEYPIFGWFLNKSANIPVDKNDTNQSLDRMNKLALKLCKNKNSVLIFPEGKICTTDEMNTFKAGGSVLAIQTGIPILPMAICGCNKIIGNNYINQEPIKIYIGKPIVTKGLQIQKHKQILTQNVYDSINQLKNVTCTSEPHVISFSFFDCFIPKCV